MLLLTGPPLLYKSSVHASGVMVVTCKGKTAENKALKALSEGQQDDSAGPGVRHQG